MTNNNNQVSVTYTDSQLRILVEEYITMQKHEFTFKSLCSYVLYWAKEEGKTVNNGLYESVELAQESCEILSRILDKLVREARLKVTGTVKSDNEKSYGEGAMFEKQLL